MGKKFDCSGWVTRANMLCSDGRIIRKDAFKDCDGEVVPLVWNHQHNRADQVLGHALLENRDEGVYGYITFNNTDSGQTAKLLVQNGDINRFSIYANKLKQYGSDVIHGVIREVSLVLAGANPGAVIESVMMHGEDSYEEGYIRSGDYIENYETLLHSEDSKEGDSKVSEVSNKSKDEDETIEDVLKTFNEKQKKALFSIIGMILGDNMSHSDKEEPDEEDAEETPEPNEETDDTEMLDEDEIKEVFDNMDEKQKTVVYAMVGKALEEGGTNDMKHNVFSQEVENEKELSHSELMGIMDDAKRCGSLKEAFLQHGIEQIDVLFPEAKNVTSEPEFIKRDDSWVAHVMNRVHKTPFSRIKSVFADITEADARARGYIKGNMKVDEVFGLLKRVTTPTTVYKKQKLDRDDVVDIVDLDVVAWLKKEMRMMLNEELARAVLVGDGRSTSSNDKINEQNIRPIWTDDDVYTVKVGIRIAKATTEEDKARNFIKSCIRSRKNYKGSGQPDMFMSEDMLTSCLLLEDKNGRAIYDSVDKLATALRVRNIIPVPVMENLKREVSSDTHFLGGIYVNLDDYNMGADKGGAVNMFDGFDIDYNAQKYLIETRCSGALTKPFAAVAIEFVIPTSELNG